MKAVLNLIRGWLLAKLLRPDQLALVQSLDAPDRFMPDVPLTAKEAEQWGQLLATPLMLKVDTAMINWTQQQAQVALGVPTPEVVRQAGFAMGCRAGWNMAKTLSRLPVANDEQSGATATTPATGLEHLEV